MSLLNPIWLWALGALSIPIAIHLLSRKEGKTIKIGSIRFLSETSTSKFSSIRLNEIALLAIRSLLIILLVVFLAKLIISLTPSDEAHPWVLVESGLENQEGIKTLTDSLKKNGYEIRRLSEAFPTPESDTSHQSPDYYKLVEDLSRVHNNRFIVIASNTSKNFKGKRIALPENVSWLSYPVQQTISITNSTQVDTLRIRLVADKSFDYDKKILRAAIQAIQSSTPAPIVIHEAEAKNDQQFSTDWLVWLSYQKLTYSGKSLQFKADPFASLISQNDKNHWVLTARLNEINSVDQHLPVQLMQMLFGQNFAHDQGIISDELAWSGSKEIKQNNTIEASHSADKILILLITLLFLSERILGFYRRQ